MKLMSSFLHLFGIYFALAVLLKQNIFQKGVEKKTL